MSDEFSYKPIKQKPISIHLLVFVALSRHHLSIVACLLSRRSHICFHCLLKEFLQKIGGRTITSNCLLAYSSGMAMVILPLLGVINCLSAS